MFGDSIFVLVTIINTWQCVSNLFNFCRSPAVSVSVSLLLLLRKDAYTTLHLSCRLRKLWLHEFASYSAAFVLSLSWLPSALHLVIYYDGWGGCFSSLFKPFGFMFCIYFYPNLGPLLCTLSHILTDSLLFCWVIKHYLWIFLHFRLLH